MSAALDNMPRQDLAKLALSARKRLRNAELDKARMGQRAMAVGVGAGASALMGYVMGGLHKQAVEESTIDTDEDPTKLAGVDIPLVVGLGATVVGVLMSGKASTRKAGEFVEAAGTGILSGYAYAFSFDKGQEADAA